MTTPCLLDGRLISMEAVEIMSSVNPWRLIERSMTERADFSVGMSECPTTVTMNWSYTVGVEPAGIESVSVEAEGCACDITGAGPTQRLD